MADIVSPTPPDVAPHPDTCATCRAETGTKRYCAPGRCYCGHPACPAYATWFDVRAVPFRDPEPKKNRHRDSWANREGETWIDSL